MQTLASMHPWFAPLLGSTFAVAASLWIGTLFSVSWLSGCARMMADGPEIGRLAFSLHRRWTAPAFWLSALTGLGWAAVTGLGRTRGLWAYGPILLLGPLVLSLHVAVGGRAKRVMQGQVEVRGEGVQRLTLVLSLGAVLALATLRSAFVP